jgi:hypothetical protein
MTTPTVTETPRALAHTERDDFADEPMRRPRREPYRRASQRELVRQSLIGDMHTHAYDRETAR